MGLEFPVPARYDDIYKHAVDLALRNCGYVAAILPASFLRSGLFRNRLSAYVLIEQNLFLDTTNPTCLALFTPRPRSTEIWIGDEHIGTLADLEAARNAHAPAKSRKRGANGMRFNASDGKLGLVCVDSVEGDTIEFRHGYELSRRNVCRSDRAITRIDVDFEVTPEVLDRLNAGLARYRKDTRDLFLAAVQGAAQGRPLPKAAGLSDRKVADRRICLIAGGGKETMDAESRTERIGRCRAF